MFPMLIHDWVAMLERLKYRIEYGENAYGEPYVFVRRGLPGDVVATLKFLHKLYVRNPCVYPESSRACYTALGIVYFDYSRNADGVIGTRIHLPETLSECMRDSAKQIFQNFASAT